MAIQKSDIKVEGNIGGLNFYRSADQYRVRQRASKKSKGEIAKIAERSNENAMEFGRASSFAKIFRSGLKTAMGLHYQLFNVSTNFNRLTKRSNLVLKADGVNKRGHRSILPANLVLFKNFSLNSNSSLKDVFLLPFDISYDGANHETKISIPSLSPQVHLDLPENTSYFAIHLVLSKINHDSLDITTKYCNSELLAVKEQIAAFDLSNSFENIGQTESILVVIGVSFYKDTAGYPVPMTDPNYNSLDVMDVIHP